MTCSARDATGQERPPRDRHAGGGGCESPRATPTAAATAGMLVIGNEILSGAIADLNATRAMRDLTAMGVRVGTVVIIPDEVPRYVEELPRLMARHDFVLSSGGVGPTHDDVTFAGVAAALGRPLARNAELARAIAQFYGPRTNEAVLGMADLPAGAELIWGDRLLIPVVQVENLSIFPGEPSIFLRKWEAVKTRFARGSYHTRALYTDLDEGELAQVMADTQQRHDGVLVGSYPTYTDPRYRVKVTLESADPAALAAALAFLHAHSPPAAAWRETV